MQKTHHNYAIRMNFSQLPQNIETSYSYISCHFFLSLYRDTDAHINNFQDTTLAMTVNVILYTDTVPTKVPPTDLLQNKLFLPSNRSILNDILGYEQRSPPPMSQHSRHNVQTMHHVYRSHSLNHKVNLIIEHR